MIQMYWSVMSATSSFQTMMIMLITDTNIYFILVTSHFQSFGTRESTSGFLCFINSNSSSIRPHGIEDSALSQWEIVLEKHPKFFLSWNRNKYPKMIWRKREKWKNKWTGNVQRWSIISPINFVVYVSHKQSSISYPECSLRRWLRQSLWGMFRNQKDILYYINKLNRKRAWDAQLCNIWRK